MCFDKRWIAIVAGVAAVLAILTFNVSAEPPSATASIVPTELECFALAEDISPAFPISAVLKTMAGNPLEGFEVHWTDSPGVGFVDQAVSTTDKTGRAENFWGYPGETLGGSETVFASFEGTSQYGPSSCESTFHVAFDCHPNICPPLLWGDIDCDLGIDSNDALVGLRFVAGMAFDHKSLCPQIGSADVRVHGRIWGDVDCDSDVDARDSLAILRRVGKFGLLSKAQGCPSFYQQIGWLLG